MVLFENRCAIFGIYLIYCIIQFVCCILINYWKLSNERSIVRLCVLISLFILVCSFVVQMLQSLENDKENNISTFDWFTCLSICFHFPKILLDLKHFSRQWTLLDFYYTQSMKKKTHIIAFSVSIGSLFVFQQLKLNPCTKSTA